MKRRRKPRRSSCNCRCSPVASRPELRCRREDGADDTDRAIGSLRRDADLVLIFALAEAGFDGPAIGDRVTHEPPHERGGRLRPCRRETLCGAVAKLRHGPAAGVRDGRPVAFHDQHQVRQRVEELGARHVRTVPRAAASKRRRRSWLRRFPVHKRLICNACPVPPTLRAITDTAVERGRTVVKSLNRNVGPRRRAAYAFAVLGAALGVATAALAHHGFGRFDRTKPVDIQGRHQGHRFREPAFVPAPRRRRRRRQDLIAMRCEMRAATLLRRSGWSAEMFVAARRPDRAGFAHRDDPASCYLEDITIGDAPTRNRNDQFTTQAVDTVEPAQAPPDRASRTSRATGPKSSTSSRCRRRRRQPRAEEHDRGRRVGRSSPCATCRHRVGARGP